MEKSSMEILDDLNLALWKGKQKLSIMKAGKCQHCVHFELFQMPNTLYKNHLPQFDLIPVCGKEDIKKERESLFNNCGEIPIDSECIYREKDCKFYKLEVNQCNNK
jgi:hypothetical protein